MVKNANGSWDTDSLVNLAAHHLQAAAENRLGPGWIVSPTLPPVWMCPGRIQARRGVSESIKMHELAAQYPDDVIFENNELHGDLQLIDPAGRAIPRRFSRICVSPSPPTARTTAILPMRPSGRSTTNDRNNPIKNELAKKVTVYFDKIGYAAGASKRHLAAGGRGQSRFTVIRSGRSPSASSNSPTVKAARTSPSSRTRRITGRKPPPPTAMKRSEVRKAASPRPRTAAPARVKRKIPPSRRSGTFAAAS